METDLKHLSKLLSLVLRHEPRRIGISLDENGWTPVNTLLERLSRKGFLLDLNILEIILKTNDKQRFAFSTDKRMIRANQGHSVEVDLQLKAETPPEILYHGTPLKFVAAILREGLNKQQRHHVHLSESREQAQIVGSRRGKPFIFKVRAREMNEAGHVFYRSGNNVWLTSEVPPGYLGE